MKLSNTTKKFAKARGLFINVEELSNGNLQVEVYADEDDSEYMTAYHMTAKGFFYHGYINMSRMDKEELPYCLETEKDFRRMIDFLATEVAA